MAIATSSPPASKRSASSTISVAHQSRWPSRVERAGPALRDELLATASAQSGRGGIEHERAQEVVEVVARLRLRRDLGVHRCDRVGIELADRGEVDREPAPDLHRVRAAVLELLVVEERVRPRGEDLVREHRRFGRVDGVHAHRVRLSMRSSRTRRPSTSSASCSVSSTSGARSRCRGSRSARRGCPGTRRPAGTSPPSGRRLPCAGSAAGFGARRGSAARAARG